MKKIQCPVCAGYGHMGYKRDKKWPGALSADMCIRCYGTGLIRVPMTNGDRIRNCTNEELAKVRANLHKWAIYADDPPRLLWDTEGDFLLWLDKETDDTDKETIFNF